MKYSKDKQDQDLLGLIAITAHDILPIDEVDSFDEALKSPPWNHATICAVHGSNFFNADKLPGQKDQLKQLPMDRYLDEGLAERYAISQSR